MTLTTYIIILGAFTWLGNIDPVWIAFIGTIFGGAGLKFIEKWLNRSKESADVRRNLHEEIKDLNSRLDTVENEVTFWRNRFYEEQEENAMLRIQLIENGLKPIPKTPIPPTQQT